MRHRRTLLAGAVALAGALTVPSAALAAPAPPANPDAHEHSAVLGQNTLQVLAEEHGLTMGVAVNTDELASSTKYRHLVEGQFGSLTAENVMKWGELSDAPGVYDWTAADYLVESAQANDQLVRGHTLVWHNQAPAYLTSGDYTAEELRDILREHVTTVASRYAGDIWQWDVVNEAFNDDGTWRETIWYQTCEELTGDGSDYIADVFRWAHEADPEALLFYNDYNLEFTGPKSNAAYAFVQELLADGVPIDGVGFQGHLATQYGFPDLQNNLERFADLGLQVALTEVDVRTFVQDKPNGKGYSSTPLTPEAQQEQEDYWRGTLEACLAVEACTSYTVWGLSDANSWIPGVFTGEGAALLWDTHLNPKPQYDVLRDVLREASEG